MDPARTDHLTAATARWLVGAAGTSARRLAASVLGEGGGADLLRVASRLRAGGLDPEQSAAALSAAQAARRLPGSLEGVGDLVLTQAALEQAGDPVVGAWRARRFAGRSVADLACGAGIDLLAIGRSARYAVGVDRDEARAVLATHNVGEAAVPAHVVVGDALAPPVRVEAVHADPSRRHAGHRLRRLGEYRPPVDAVLANAPTRDCGVVVSPAVAWDDPDLPAACELEFIQLGGDLVEGVVWTGALRQGQAVATATLLDAAGGAVTRSRTGDVDPLPPGVAGAYLLDVVPAAVRARLHDELGREVGARRLAAGRALLTVDDAPPPSPWWTPWRVEASLPVRAKVVRAWLRAHDDGRPLTIATRGLDADVEAWWRDLGRPHRGPGGRRLLLVRTDTGGAAMILTPG